jgi:hypothetical protein
MINAFYIEDMTCLRYAIPFIKTVKRLIDNNVLLIYNDTVNSHKYNSIINHYEKLLKICEVNSIECINQKEFKKDSVKIQNLFCVENTSKDIDCDNYYSFQHGFDWEILHKNNKEATYIVTEEHFKNAIENLGLRAMVSPIPVVFWDWAYNIERINLNLDNKTVTMFYPEQGNKDLFKKIHTKLKELGYTPYVKQRKKNQLVPSEFSNVFYDDLWYPTESIFLPIISDFCVGFGTSAYTDLIHLNKDFIDLCIPDYSKKYYKPQVSNLISITKEFYENFCKLNFNDITLLKKLTDPCDSQKIENFLRQVFIC